MKNKLIIRPAAQDDYKEMIKVFDSWRPNNWDSKYAKRYYRDFFDNHNSTSQDKVFVGVLDERIIGVTGYCPETKETENIYWLNWFYVHQDFQHHGYGRQLLEHVIGILKNKRARKLFVYTTSDDFYEPTRDFYKKMGFQKEGVLKDYYGKGEHEVYYGLSLK
jgi:ribosomal protein S18 acetylase RimI-like enzyme